MSEEKGIEWVSLGRPQDPGATRAASAFSAIYIAAGLLARSTRLRLDPAFRNATIIHANTSRAAIIAALACAGSRRLLVVHLRDYVTKESLGSFGFSAFRYIVLRRANGLVANSKATLATVDAKVLGRAYVQVIPSPAGLRMASFRSPVESSELTVCLIARLDRWKGQQLLLEAFSAAFKDTPARLIFAGAPAFGNETYERQLRDEARALGIDDRVMFLGHVSDIPQLLETVDICVQCSIRPEPLGQNVLQYLAAGKPTIASAEGGPTEWIIDGRNGLLFEPRSVIGLAAALTQLRNSLELRSTLAAGAAATPNLLTDEQVAHATSDFYRALIAREPPSRRRTTSRKIA